MSKIPGEFMDIKECAEYLRIRPSTIYKWISISKQSKTATIPHLKLHGRLLFRTTEILKWVIERKV